MSGKILVKCVRSKAGANPKQRATLVGLGLMRRGQVRELDDTPSIRGMVKKIPHLAQILK